MSRSPTRIAWATGAPSPRASRKPGQTSQRAEGQPLVTEDPDLQEDAGPRELRLGPDLYRRCRLLRQGARRHRGLRQAGYRDPPGTRRVLHAWLPAQRGPLRSAIPTSCETAGGSGGHCAGVASGNRRRFRERPGARGRVTLRLWRNPSVFLARRARRDHGERWPRRTSSASRFMSSRYPPPRSDVCPPDVRLAPCVPEHRPYSDLLRRAPHRSRAPPRGAPCARASAPRSPLAPSRALLFPRRFPCDRALPLGSSVRSPESARLRTSRPLRGATPLLSRFPLKGIPSGNAGRASEERPGARSSANEPTEKAALTKETIP